jgi:hypothetical protein
MSEQDSAASVDGARLVFVAGLHRSGTTPLARTLAEHPDISGLRDTGVKEDEGQHLQPVYPKAKVYGGPGRFANDPRSHLTESSELVSAHNAQLLIDAWSPYWDLTRPLLLEKSPPNLVMGRFLQALFPGSAFVTVIRHPVIVALSTVKWRRLISRNFQNYTSVESMVGHWLAAHDTFVDDLPHLSRVRVLRYEDLVADPVAGLAPLQALLRLDSAIAPGGLKASHSQRYEDDWKRMSASLLGRREYHRIIDRYGERIARYGYDVQALGVTGPLDLA